MHEPSDSGPSRSRRALPVPSAAPSCLCSPRHVSTNVSQLSVVYRVAAEICYVPVGSAAPPDHGVYQVPAVLQPPELLCPEHVLRGGRLPAAADPPDTPFSTNNRAHESLPSSLACLTITRISSHAMSHRANSFAGNPFTKCAMSFRTG